jgi:hypothetical protein
MTILPCKRQGMFQTSKYHPSMCPSEHEKQLDRIPVPCLGELAGLPPFGELPPTGKHRDREALPASPIKQTRVACTPPVQVFM